MLGRLATDQRAAGLAAALGHAGHDGGDAVGVDLAGRDVVEHEQRLGTGADEVVDTHGDQVDADGLVATGGPRHLELGADPVGRRDQDRVRVALGVEGELPAEAADAADQRAQTVDRGVARRDVHTGAGVGGAALAHGSDPGEGALVRRAAAGSGRPSSTGVLIGTGTGVG